MQSHKETCSANHEGSSGKVNGAIEMFKRSEDLHGVKYLSYIGDSDCKTYKGIVESQPYGENIMIIEKECVGYIQKRMGSRFRNIKKDKKGLEKRGKIDGKINRRIKRLLWTCY